MKKIFTFIVSAMLAVTATAAPTSTVKERAKGTLSKNAFRFAPKAKAEKREIGSSASACKLEQKCANGKSPAMVAARDFVIDRLPAADMQGYLDGPNDETWYYTMNYTKELVDHGTWKENLIKGYKVTVYNATLDEVGTVEDVITFGDNETKVAQVEVGAVVTKTFFNYDNNYEIMIAISCNTSEFVNHNYTKVYSIGKEGAIANIEGYYISAVNTATDAWSEKYWITFLTEEETTTPEINGIANSADQVFTTYKSAGYSGMGDPVLKTRIPIITLSGENAIPFVSTAYNGQPYFAVSHMKYSWYQDPNDFTNDNPTANNELICDVYTTPSAWASTVELYSTTTIPSETTVEDCYFLYLGAFSYYDDLSFGRYTNDGTPSLIISREHFIPGKDGYTYDFFVCKAAAKGTTANGQKLVDIANNVEIGYFMSDIAGEDPQVMFARNEGDNNYIFDFVNLVTGEKQFSMNYAIGKDEYGEDVFMTTETDRIATPGGYMYVCPQTSGHSDGDGNMITGVAYVRTDGTIDHVDQLYLGPDVDLARIYSGYEAFNPYIFNIDDNREYLVLVKRRNMSGEVGNHEELLVVSSDPMKDFLLQLTPDETLGVLTNIALVNTNTGNPKLAVIYTNDNAEMATQLYALPLSLYEEGNGTAENPYVITTLGGLKQIKANPASHYVLGCDIDAKGAELKHNTDFSFSGTLDGQNHTISNLIITGRPFLPNIVAAGGATEAGNGPVVKNITFVNSVYNATGSNQGLLTGNATGATINNVHVCNGKVTCSEVVSGLIGKASLYTNISECSFDGEITCTEDEGAAGIVCVLQTSSTVNACSFAGKINAGSTIGGIAAETHNNAGTISNCHVNADIKGMHTIGGIVASSQRAPIINCHVEGTIEATESPRWGGGPNVGGIVGELSPAINIGDETRAAEGTSAVIKGCYVNLTSLKYTGDASTNEDYKGQNDTMHRIVGKSCVNEKPEVIDYNDEWEPIYGEPNAPEAAIADNYAVATLSKVAEAIADEANTTEGKSIAAGEANMDFFVELGWAYGNTAETPWAVSGDYTHPSLYFEGGMFVATPSIVTVAKDNEFTIELSTPGKDITEDMFESFSFDVDESMFEIGDMSSANGKIVLKFKALKEGKSTMSFGLNGKTAKVEVTVTSSSSVENIAADKIAIIINGRTATAQGCMLNVYATTGANMMKGNESVSLDGLAAGVYIIKASADNGATMTKKVVIR